jgi:hypothetical protein
MKIGDIERAQRLASELKNLEKQAEEFLTAKYYHVHRTDIPGEDTGHSIEAMRGSTTTGGDLYDAIHEALFAVFKKRISIVQGQLRNLGVDVPASKIDALTKSTV